MNKKIFNWIGRSILLLIIIFFTIFSFDAESFLGWIMHMIPAFILIITLIVAWKYKLIGGIIILVLGLISIFFFHTYREIISFLIISLPILISGGMFILADKFKK